MKVSVQCYTVRRELEQDLWGTFRALADIGLKYAELGGTYGLPPSELRRGLEEIGLGISGNHCSAKDLDSKMDEVISDNLALGCKYLTLGWVPASYYANGWAE